MGTEAPPPRDVTLVLCRRDGSIVGALSPFAVTVPWWQEVAPIVDAASDRYSVAVTVLRLLHAVPNERSAGGPVTYLAEIDDGSAPTTTPWVGDLRPDAPRRATWARPGGPAADLAWADAALVALGIPRVAAAQQVRTWNLSSLWRIPTDDGAAWLKVVPPFFAHEGAVVSALAGHDGPRVLASSGPRLLMAEAAGEDQYEAVGAVLIAMVTLLVRIQAQWAARVDELLVMGVPDWRSAKLVGRLATLVRAHAARLDIDVADRLESLVHGLPERFAQIADCGLPDTLVHGDFHRGNVRRAGERLVLLDWGDSGVGHPMLDQAAFLDRMPSGDRLAVRAAWAQCWREWVPGCDPVRAAALLEPVAALRQALIYQTFLDGIEEDERIYHAHDPGIWLRRAARLAASAPGPTLS